MSAGRALLGLAALLAASACVPTPPSRLYLLRSASQAAAAGAGGPVVFVDPATVAPYADRAQLVTRTRDGRVVLDELDAWAEPPGAQVTAVLVDELAARLGRDNVLATPGRRGFEPDVRVAVEVLRLDADDAAGEAVVDARWTVFAGRDGRLAGTGRERVAERVAAPGDVPARVAAFNRALAKLGERLARAVRGAAPKGARRAGAVRGGPEA